MSKEQSFSSFKEEKEKKIKKIFLKQHAKIASEKLEKTAEELKLTPEQIEQGLAKARERQETKPYGE